MNGVKQLNLFFEKAVKDERLLPSHISLYVAVVDLKSRQGFNDTVKVFRKDLMQLAHINSLATYHKCIKQLNDFGYLRYEPSYNYFKGCTISFLNQ